MPPAEYEHRTDSVLAWKKAQKLGRFDPNAPSIEQQKIRASEREVEERGKRNRLLCTSRATYSYDSGGCVLKKAILGPIDNCGYCSGSTYSYTIPPRVMYMPQTVPKAAATHFRLQGLATDIMSAGFI